MTQNSDLQEIQALYQRIMAEIEPDLLMEHIPGLAQKYAGESDADRAVRQTRYAAAFAECFQRIDAVLEQMKKDTHTFKAHVINLCKKKDDASHADVLDSLEHSLTES